MLGSPFDDVDTNPRRGTTVVVKTPVAIERRKHPRIKVSQCDVASFAVTPAEKRRLQKKAALARMSLSSFLRKHLQALL